MDCEFCPHPHLCVMCVCVCVCVCVCGDVIARSFTFSTLFQLETSYWLMRPHVGGEAKWINPQGVMKSIDPRYTEDCVARVTPNGPLQQPRDIFDLRHSQSKSMREHAWFFYGPGPAAPRAGLIPESERARNHLVEGVAAQGGDATSREDPAPRRRARGAVHGAAVAIRGT